MTRRRGPRKAPPRKASVLGLALVPRAPTEKQVEPAGDRLMQSLGFRAVRFSQARATQQTPGIPDRRYVSRARCAAFWWEAKRTTDGAYGQTAPQREFQRDCEAVGEAYVLGALDALERYCVARGWLRELRPGVFMPVRPSVAPPASPPVSPTARAAGG